MAQTYNQTATAAGAGSAIACSGGVLIGGGQEKNSLCTVGGTAGGAVTVGGSQLDAETNQAGVMYELVPVNSIWASGNWTVRLNVTTLNANVTWTGTFICRLNSANVSQATIGSLTGQTTSLGTTGVKTHTVSGSAQTPAGGDKVYIVLIFSSSAANQSFGVTFNSSIDSPFSDLTPKTFAPAADDWNDLLDGSLAPLAGDRRVGVVDLDALPEADSFAFDRPAIGPETPITKTFTDTWQNLNDGTLNQGADHFFQFPDTANNLADQLAASVSTLTPKQFTGTDSLNSWADSLGNLIADYFATLSDTWNNLADQLATRFTGALQFTGADSLNNWADSPAVLRTGALVASPAADSLNNWTDSPAVSVTGTLTCAPAADSLNNWNDSANAFRTIGAQVTDPWLNLADQFNVGGQAALTFTGTDSLNNWADSLTVLRMGALTAALSDPWGNLADTLAAVRQTPNLTVSLSDPWQNLSDGTLNLIGDRSVQFTDAGNNLADQLTASVAVGTKTFSGTDSLNNWAEITDRLIADYLVTDSDAWGNLADQLAVAGQLTTKTFTGTDSLNLWVDSPSAVETFNVQAADPWQNLADAVAGFFTLNAQAPADSWAQLNDLLQIASGGLIAVGFIDGMGFLADQVAAREAFNLQVTDPWLNLADTYDRSVVCPVNLTDPWANLADTYVRSLGLVAGLTDPWANLADSSAAFFTIAPRFTDPWQNLADQLITGAQGTLVFTSTDSLNNWTDAPAILRALVVALADTAANLADAVAGVQTYQWAATDSAANLADQFMALEASLVAFADNAFNLADQLLASTVGGQFTQLTDAWNNLADQLRLVVGLAPQLTDTWQNLADAIALRLAIIQILISQVSQQTEVDSELSAQADITSVVGPSVELTSEVSA